MPTRVPDRGRMRSRCPGHGRQLADGTPDATASADTIAIRAPIPESVQRMRQFVDDIVLAAAAALLEAMDLALATLGVLPEPAGAAGIAAIRGQGLPGERLATVITGGNIRPDLFLSFVGARSPAVPAARRGA
jgi:threonine dehydratase